MNKWVKKTFVTLVTLLTFGIVTPYQTIQAAENSLDKHDNNDIVNSTAAALEKEDLRVNYTDTNEEENLSPQEKFVKKMMDIGEKQSLKKFGDRIAPVIEDEFQQLILPNIEKAIADVTSQFSEDDLEWLAISEEPGKGLSEKIFHIYNEKTNQDVIRVHVRRDLRPLEGYWFNFHYHTYHDGFQTHYELGEIYWDKNTPPKWSC